jgi:hypothetical protein
MTLEDFVQRLQSMLKNPHATTLAEGVLYFFSDGGELIAFDTGKQSIPIE